LWTTEGERREAEPAVGSVGDNGNSKLLAGYGCLAVNG
jgi:hypothetical protein